MPPRTLRQRVYKNAEPYIYLAPTIALFVFILLIPLFNLFKYSLGEFKYCSGV